MHKIKSDISNIFLPLSDYRTQYFKRGDVKKHWGISTKNQNRESLAYSQWWTG